MALYRKLSYVGSIWSLFTYVFLLGSSVILPASTGNMMPFLEISQPQSYQFMSSLTGFMFLTGFIGVVMSVIAIVVTRKINATRRKLFLILIFVGIVLWLLQWGQYNFVVGIFNQMTAGSSFYGAAEATFENNFFTQMKSSALIGLIPSFLLLVSGVLAFRIYRKPKNPILD